MPDSTSNDTLGINCDGHTLANGQCSFDVNQVVGRQTPADANATVLAQDLMLSATYIIGTVVLIALMYSGFVYIMAKDDSGATKGKNGIKRSLIGLLLVLGSYSIIRLLQYIAKG